MYGRLLSMRVMRLYWIVLSTLVVTLPAWGCREAAAPIDTARRFEVVGVVVAPVQDGMMTVAHEDVAGLMPAMTMSFALVDPGDGARLSPGDRVTFTLIVEDERSRAEHVVVTGRDATVAAAAARAPRASARLRNGDAVPAFTLVDQDGGAVTAADLRGHATIVTFVFTRCPVPDFCPLMTARFKTLQGAITADPARARGARLLSVTLDPEHDTPAVLREYGRAKGADFTRWRFATGSSDQIAVLTRAFAVRVEQNGASLDHTLATALLDEQGRVVDIWRGNQWQVEEVLEALRAHVRPQQP